MSAKRPFAVFDIDGTLIRWQLYHAISDQLVKLGYIDPDGYQVIKDARLAWKKRRKDASFKSYEQLLVSTHSKNILSLTSDQFEQAVNAAFEEYKDQTYTYTRDLIAKLKKENYILFAISGSQTEIVEKIAHHWGFDDFRASTYERVGNKFSGQLSHYLGRKDEALAELVKAHAVTTVGSVAVGDSMSDVAILEAVERPIAFNPELELYEYARKKSWSIVVERKNVIYELSGKNGKYELA